MKIEVFGKQGCAICQTTKRKLAHFLEKWNAADRVKIEFVDVETVEGMAEGAFRDVSDIPTTIISYKGGVLGRWDGGVPPSEEVKRIVDAPR